MQPLVLGRIVFAEYSLSVIYIDADAVDDEFKLRVIDDEIDTIDREGVILGSDVEAVIDVLPRVTSAGIGDSLRRRLFSEESYGSASALQRAVISLRRCGGVDKTAISNEV